jgi:FtsH-binding integral membrane protein
MSMYPQSRPYELDYGTDSRAIVNFFNTVYAWMCVGLAVTATVAWLVSQNTQLLVFMNSRGIVVAVLLGLVLLAWGIQSAAHRISPTAATALFLLYAAAIGFMISFIFLVYPWQTIVAAFVVTAGTFAGMSVYGFVTKRDLTRMGSILIMAVWGLFLASLVNIFLGNNALGWIITYGVLAVFIGMTAYDTQKLREIAVQTQGDAKMAARYAIVGSLHLYIDFINIFMSILRILGNRR